MAGMVLHLFAPLRLFSTENLCPSCTDKRFVKRSGNGPCVELEPNCYGSRGARGGVAGAVSVGEPLPILEAPQAYGVRRQIMLADAPIQAILVAADIERAKKFYVEKLGLQPVDAPLPEDGAAFESGKGTWLYMYEREGGSRADHTVAGWMVDDVETAVAELRKRGVVFQQYDVPGLKTDERGIAVSGPAKSAWFKDTEGNILAVTEM